MIKLLALHDVCMCTCACVFAVCIYFKTWSHFECWSVVVTEVSVGSSMKSTGLAFTNRFIALALFLKL